MRWLRQWFLGTKLWIIAVPLFIGYLGAASNQLVLYVNHDTFPVRVNPLKAFTFTDHGKDIVRVPPIAGILPDGAIMLDDVHCVMTDKTHLNLLADIFDFHDETDSIGDLLIGAGAYLQTYAFVVWVVVMIKGRDERSLSTALR